MPLAHMLSSFVQGQSILQYQNKALANANKQLKQKLATHESELADKNQLLHNCESNLGSLASALVKVSPSKSTDRLQTKQSLEVLGQNPVFAQKQTNSLREILDKTPNSTLQAVRSLLLANPNASSQESEISKASEVARLCQAVTSSLTGCMEEIVRAFNTKGKHTNHL